jgi:hypothetical protein
MINADRSVQVNLRLPASLKEAAEKAAAADHRSLTSLVEKLLSDHVRVRPTLEDWHERAQTRLLGILAEKQPKAKKQALLARSYAIETRSSERINPALLTRTLQIIHAELSNFIPNPEIFYPYTRVEIAPYFVYDSRFSTISDEILECIALPENHVRNTEFWRISPTGIASDVRDFPEDHENFRQLNLEPGRWFSPLLMARELYSLTQHAYLFSERFSSAATVQFRCEWTGLLEREIRDHEPMADYLPGKMARVDSRVTTGEWPVSAVRMEWPEIASALGAPVIRLFDPNFDYTADFIRSQMRRITG